MTLRTELFTLALSCEQDAGEIPPTHFLSDVTIGGLDALHAVTADAMHRMREDFVGVGRPVCYHFDADENPRLMHVWPAADRDYCIQLRRIVRVSEGNADAPAKSL